MQFIVEFLTAAVVWAATLAFSQLGIDVDLRRQDESRAERTVQRTQMAAPLPIARECPETRKTIAASPVRAV